MKRLRLFNGRWTDEKTGQRNNCDHVYIAAWSKADAKRIVIDYLGYEPRGLAREIDVYWSHDAWGNQMDGITPERGVWVSRGKPYGTGYEKPERVWPNSSPSPL